MMTCKNCLHFFDCWDAGDCTEEYKPCPDFYERDQKDKKTLAMHLKQ